MTICIPITAGGEAAALKEIGQGVAQADIIELRMDLIGSAVGPLIEEIRRRSLAAGIIVTNRRSGRARKGATAAEKKRLGLLEEAVILGADYVDVELDADPSLRRKLRTLIREQDNGTRLIVSHHDFVGTPSERALQDIFRSCVRAGADIVKIATFARCAADNLRVLSLIPYGRKKKKETIAFCMGEEGRISRIAAPILGSYLTFASLKRGAESAPGQITAREMRRIDRLIRGKCDE